MSNRTARLVSAFIHPATVPVMIYMAVFFVDDSLILLDFWQKVSLLGVIVFMAVLVPGANLYFLYRSGAMRSLYMESRQDRPVPFLFTALYYGMTGYFLYRNHADPILWGIMVAMSGSVILLTVMTLYFQASAHLCAVGGAFGLLCGIASMREAPALLWPCIAFALASGAVGSARLALGAHTPVEAATGFGAGFVCCAATMAAVL